MLPSFQLCYAPSCLLQSALEGTPCLSEEEHQVLLLLYFTFVLLPANSCYLPVLETYIFLNFYVFPSYTLWSGISTLNSLLYQRHNQAWLLHVACCQVYSSAYATTLGECHFLVPLAFNLLINFCHSNVLLRWSNVPTFEHCLLLCALTFTVSVLLMTKFPSWKWTSNSSIKLHCFTSLWYWRAAFQSCFDIYFCNRAAVIHLKAVKSDSYVLNTFKFVLTHLTVLAVLHTVAE